MQNNNTTTFPLPKLSEDKKYQIADVIVSTCVNLPADIIKENSRFYFREVINSPIRIKNQVVKVCDAFQEDDANHITNLVLQRLQAPSLFKSTANVEYTEEQDTAPVGENVGQQNGSTI